MTDDARVTSERVIDEAGRRLVIEVLGETYQREKCWVSDPAAQFPGTDLVRDDIAWFIAFSRDRPAGVLRVLYDPPVAAYAEYGLEMIDDRLDVQAFLAAGHRIAEIGRFAVLPRYRNSLMVAAALMRAATEESVARGYTHFITDVFEDDPHSPYGFHTRVIGFLPVATHAVGELNSASRRITLVLDLKAAYARLKRSGNWIYRYLTGRWSPALHQRLAA